jgi:argininosuccinate lyase
VSADRFGILSRAPHALLTELLYEPGYEKDEHWVLGDLIDIDCAHLIMLRDTGVLPNETARALLAVNLDFKHLRAEGKPVLEPESPHRGLYAVYEDAYRRRLGADVGGAAHVARSRNDINATVFRLRLRRMVLDLTAHVLDFCDVGVRLARAHLQTVMSGFTHGQPAQPTTLAHVLAGFLAEVMRSAKSLWACYSEINRSPMGAAAGFGTSIAIDRQLVAELLGFSEPIANSLDAVGSRDVGIRVLSAAATLGISYTRLATDLQLWSSAAYEFLKWPDDLVSTSSIMPQKRNAYVLENVRGQAIHAAGAITNMLISMKSTPFTNGIEVSGEAPGHIWPALDASIRATRLLALLLAHVEVRPDTMKAFASKHLTTMTALADYLVQKHGLGFRNAHEVVAGVVKAGLASQGAERIAAALEDGLRGAGHGIALDRRELAELCDPVGCVAAARFGGGPAAPTVEQQLVQIQDESESLRKQRQRAADTIVSADKRRLLLAKKDEASCAK